MIRTILLSSFLIAIATTYSFTQVLQVEDFGVEENVRELLHSEISNKEYVILSIAGKNTILILSEGNDCYREYFLVKNDKSNSLEVKKSKKIKSSQILEDMFADSIYRKEFITFDSEFFQPNGYEFSLGELTYFVFINKNGDKLGEARLSVFINPNPINQEIYMYLIRRILHYNRQ